jgi:hypothetical protein
MRRLDLDRAVPSSLYVARKGNISLSHYGETTFWRNALLDDKIIGLDANRSLVTRVLTSE